MVGQGLWRKVASYTTEVRNPTESAASDGDVDPRDRLGGAVPSPSAAFLLSVIALPTLFWLIALKRTTDHIGPEDWLMGTVVPNMEAWVAAHVPVLDKVFLGISALGSGWFVGFGFAVAGLFLLARRRADLALLLAVGTLCFPMEWALKYFTSVEPISLAQLVNSLFDIGGIGLDDLTDFPAGHALRATVFYGLLAFCVARMSPGRARGMTAYALALVLIGAISLVRIYLGAHYPIDVIGGWIAGAALLSVIVAIHVLNVDERIRARQRATATA